MSCKEQRWYEVVDGIAYVYDEPHKERACSVSTVPVSDLAYYRRTFKLSKVWE